MNSARRDLCGGYLVTGIPTATSSPGEKINRNLPFCCREFNRFSWFLICQKKPLHYPILNAR